MQANFTMNPNQTDQLFWTEKNRILSAELLGKLFGDYFEFTYARWKSSGNISVHFINRLQFQRLRSVSGNSLSHSALILIGRTDISGPASCFCSTDDFSTLQFCQKASVKSWLTWVLPMTQETFESDFQMAYTNPSDQHDVYHYYNGNNYGHFMSGEIFNFLKYLHIVPTVSDSLSLSKVFNFPQ